MKRALTRITVSLAALLFVVSSSLAADKAQTYVGKVSDAMCGAEHMEAGVTAADCTRDCVSKGSKYALVVGEKVYTLDGEDKAALDELNKLADQRAKITGTATGDTIQVKSVAPAK
jgi:hypothetical protein